MAVDMEFQKSQDPVFMSWKWIKKWVKYFEMELVITFHTFPGYLSIIALLTLPIEKACRFNLGFSDLVCDNLNNGTLKAACGPINSFHALPEPSDAENAFVAVLDKISIDFNFSSAEIDVLKDICRAETEAQKLQVNINQVRALLGYLGLVVIMYIGPLGDKYNRKKLFLLLPMTGELINTVAYLVTSLFQSSVPIEFHLVVERLMHSIFGGFPLMAMGIFAYLAASVDEKNRTFRFGVFAIFQLGLGTIVTQLSAPAFTYLGYVNLFTFSTIVHLFGVLYIIFYVKEIPLEKQEQAATAGVDNLAFAASALEIHPKLEALPKEPIRGSFWREGVELIKFNFEIFKVSRPANGKMLLLLVIGTHSLVMIKLGEHEVGHLYGRLAWGWTTEFGMFVAYNTAMAFIGSILVTSIFVKVLKITDPILIIISFICNAISKPILALTTTTFWIYAASTIDMFNIAPAIATRSILSKIVSSGELGRCYTVIAVLDILVHPLGSLIYNTIYENTIYTFPGAFFFVSSGILVVATIIFLRINVLFNEFERATPEKSLKKEKEGKGAPTETGI